MNKVISFLSTLILSSTSLLAVSACKARCSNQQNQEAKAEFELISKIEIKKTDNDQFAIRFYKENVTTKGLIPNNFWHLTNDNKYVAEFNNISDKTKKSLINTLKIKDNYYPDFTVLKDWELKNVTLTYKIKNKQKQMTNFNANLVADIPVLLSPATIPPIEKEINQEIKAEFEEISKIEIKKTDNNQFAIRFYKENVTTKGIIPNNFWHLTNDNKYVAEFNNISDKTKKSLINTLKIKEDDYYPDFTVLKDWELKNVTLTYKINNNQKQMTNFNANLVADIQVLSKTLFVNKKKAEFEKISKIEIKKTDNDQFAIRFYKENVTTKGIIPNNFWHLTNDNKYVAEFNNISDKTKKSLINTLKIKEDDYYPDFTVLKDWELKNVTLTYKIKNKQKQMTNFNANLVADIPVLLSPATIPPIEKKINQEIKAEFEEISKIEIKKTDNDQFAIRFYKENVTTKGIIPNNFWHLTNDGKYVAEFNNISDEIKKNIINTLKIKEDDYYPDFTVLKDWELKNVTLTYKINNNQKQMTNFNANFVIDIVALLNQTTFYHPIENENEINQEDKAEFEKISKIEIKKTDNDQFAIRFYKENVTTKGIIPNNFWHLTNDNKYVAEFNNISDEIKKNIINTLKIKEDDYYPDFILLKDWELKNVTLTYKINNNQKEMINFNENIIDDIPVLLNTATIPPIEKEINQEDKAEFEKISKIEIKKTDNNQFAIRFYKENVTTKSIIPNNFWHLTNDGKYVAEFNNISDENKKNIINTLKIKDNYYPDFTVLKDRELKNVTLTYKINNNQKEMINFNANFVIDIVALLKKTTTPIEKEINQEAKAEDYYYPDFTLLKDWDLKNVTLIYKVNNNQKEMINFNAKLVSEIVALLSPATIPPIEKEINQEAKAEFELISKIEIKKTDNNQFAIRFYKENVTTKSIIPNDFWYLTDDGKYVAEFNNISDEIKKNIINTLRIKENDYYPDFTTLKDWNLKNITLTYKINNNEKQMINFNANLVADIQELSKTLYVNKKQAEFELISKIEIKKTDNNQFAIRFYKENVTTKSIIPNNFWHLTDDGKYVAEFNNISDEIKKNIINTLRIKENDYYPDFTTLKDWNLKNITLTYKINNNEKQMINFNANLVADIQELSKTLYVNKKQAEFELISKIEIKKTDNNQFAIRFYKENVNTKGLIPNNFWHLTDDGKYVAEFNNISDEIKKNLINTLRIKENDYYPDFTLLNGWDLKNVTLTYKINNNEKQMINFNANLVADIQELSKTLYVNKKQAEFELISKIEIKKTDNNQFAIRFYKENVNTKGLIPNNFWHLTDDGKYVAEFNNISDEIKKNLINTLRIKENDYYPDFTLLNGWDLKNVTLTYKINNNEKQMINFNANLVADIQELSKTLYVNKKQAEFELISKIEIKKTDNNQFAIRFYKENVNTKGLIPNNFWHLTDDGKYVAEFNNISDEIKKNLINTLRIKENDYYPDFTLLNGWDLKNVTLTYKINNNEKQMINFNANLVADISVLLKKDTVAIENKINQEWISESTTTNPKFTEKWWNFVENDKKFKNKLKNIFINWVKKQINLDIIISDFDWEIEQYPYNVKTDINNRVYYFVILINANGKNQLRNQYKYKIIIYNSDDLRKNYSNKPEDELIYHWKTKIVDNNPVLTIIE